jgi:hypothetical protein
MQKSYGLSSDSSLGTLRTWCSNFPRLAGPARCTPRGPERWLAPRRQDPRAIAVTQSGSAICRPNRWYRYSLAMSQVLHVQKMDSAIAICEAEVVVRVGMMCVLPA